MADQPHAGLGKITQINRSTGVAVITPTAQSAIQNHPTVAFSITKLGGRNTGLVSVREGQFVQFSWTEVEEAGAKTVVVQDVEALR